MAVNPDAAPVDVDKAFLFGVLDRVGQLVNSPELPYRTVPELKKVVAEVLAEVTPSALNDVLGARLKAIAERSPEELIDAANPAVRLLKRRPRGRMAPEANHFRALLAGSEGYATEELGDLVLDMNPYFSDPVELGTDEQIDQQITDAKLPNRHGGPFKQFSSLGKWQTGNRQFPKIPKPGEGPAGFDRSWYMLTGWTPRSLPDPITGLPGPDLAKVRNILKTVEIVYGDPTADADGQVGVDTGENWPPSHPLAGKPKKKPAHILIMYAGGNGT